MQINNSLDIAAHSLVHWWPPGGTPTCASRSPTWCCCLCSLGLTEVCSGQTSTSSSPRIIWISPPVLSSHSLVFAAMWNNLAHLNPFESLNSLDNWILKSSNVNLTSKMLTCCLVLSYSSLSLSNSSLTWANSVSKCLDLRESLLDKVWAFLTFPQSSSFSFIRFDLSSLKRATYNVVSINKYSVATGCPRKDVALGEPLQKQNVSESPIYLGLCQPIFSVAKCESIPYSQFHQWIMKFIPDNQAHDIFEPKLHHH